LANGNRRRSLTVLNGTVDRGGRTLRRARDILVLVTAAAVLAAGCGGASGSGGGSAGYDGRAEPTSSRAEPTSSRGGAAGDADSGDVRIADFAFTPATVKARVGQRVRWEQQDPGVTHTVTAVGGGSRFASGELHEGDEFSHRFPAAGTFAYRCAIHPNMRGTVKVAG
jgi:plastocyanin